MPFTTLGLSAELVRAVTDRGYQEPSPIQQQAIPVILEGKDLMAGAQTGTGKTAAFTLPLLQRLSEKTEDTGGKPQIRALVITPTRELAAQVNESVRAYGKYLPFRSVELFGGVDIRPQITALRRGVDIVVATPGRLLDHARQGTLDLFHVEILVLDEADRMLDMGFIPDVRKIMTLVPRQRQGLLFFATFSEDMRQLAKTFLRTPVLIEVTQRNTVKDSIAQSVHPVDRQRKAELLSFLIGSQNWQRVLVFTKTKHAANRLSQQLERGGIRATAIHSNKTQKARTRALESFKAGSVRVLVATDIAARGLDIEQIPHVVNFELPHVSEDYIHRIGRTGRAGNEGKAVSLVCADEQKLLRSIEYLLKYEIPKEIIPGYEPTVPLQSEPVRFGQGISQSRGRISPSAGKSRRRSSVPMRHGSRIH
uniref:DEAD-box ATP-dependent RNA helicase RhpA n=1 Tax=Candidatus Kentrum sp. DK TaxID=2126562 RepID=A0A450SK27_9GAMM|nr:MAG: ATP-dependent RNA helicase RhlE [Candidatus Kentron sp. DK]VFJ53881.1 MAG: ATP-dependent RNA helicase RhlE [Candidatus Kentron sp. DK]